MSFGIEFDIGEGDDGYELLSEKESRARKREAEGRDASEDTSRDAVPPSDAGKAPSAGDAPMREHRFDKLLALTNDIREHDRRRWLKRYASMRVPSRGAADSPEGHAPAPAQQDGPASSGARQGHRKADGGVAAEGASQGDAVGAQSRHLLPSEQAVGAEDGMRDALGNAHAVPDEHGTAQSAQPDQASVRQDEGNDSVDGADGAAEEVPEDAPSSNEGADAAHVLAVSATALAVLSVALALVPVAGRVLWVVPAVLSVMLAVPALIAAYRKGRSLVLPTAAIILALAAMVVSAAAGQAYVTMGVVSVSHGEAGTTVSVK